MVCGARAASLPRTWPNAKKKIYIYTHTGRALRGGRGGWSGHVFEACVCPSDARLEWGRLAIASHSRLKNLKPSKKHDAEAGEPSRTQN